jgi:hypothetical protein
MNQVCAVHKREKTLHEDDGFTCYGKIRFCINSVPQGRLRIDRVAIVGTFQPSLRD